MDPIGKTATGLVRSNSGNAAASASASEPQSLPRTEMPTGGGIAVLSALGRPPSQGAPDKIGRFSVIGRVASADRAELQRHQLEKKIRMPRMAATLACNFETKTHQRLAKRCTTTTPMTRCASPSTTSCAAGSPIWSLMEWKVSGRWHRCEPVCRLVMSSTGCCCPQAMVWGQDPLSADAFARMKTQLAAAPAGTVLQEHGLMSSRWGHTTPHSEGGRCPLAFICCSLLRNRGSG